MKLPVKLVWLKDQTQVSMGLLSLPISFSLCTKWDLNLHLPRKIQIFHHLILLYKLETLIKLYIHNFRYKSYYII
ncbi:hypothetical protein Hanom_Chr11g01035091 [Helianthus anomalus]